MLLSIESLFLIEKYEHNPKDVYFPQLKIISFK